jgi:hypothetical protein
MFPVFYLEDDDLSVEHDEATEDGESQVDVHLGNNKETLKLSLRLTLIDQ